MADVQVNLHHQTAPAKPARAYHARGKSHRGVELATETGGREHRGADIGVVRKAGHAPFLRSHADAYWNDNLLSLNQCPL
jgi:Protein of unknown function (DUF3892)